MKWEKRYSAIDPEALDRFESGGSLSAPKKWKSPQWTMEDLEKARPKNQPRPEDHPEGTRKHMEQESRDRVESNDRLTRWEKDRAHTHDMKFPHHISAEHMEKYHPNASPEFTDSNVRHNTCNHCGHDNTKQVRWSFPGDDHTPETKSGEEPVISRVISCSNCGASERHIRVTGQNGEDASWKIEGDRRPSFEENKNIWKDMSSKDRSTNHHLHHTGGWYGFDTDPTGHMHKHDGTVEERPKMNKESSWSKRYAATWGEWEDHVKSPRKTASSWPLY